MSENKFKKLLVKSLSDDSSDEDDENLFLFVRECNDSDVFIRDYLIASYKSRDWDKVQHLVIAGFQRPSKKYSKILCDILDEFLDEMNNEDIIELLGDIKDESTIGCLKRVLIKNIPHNGDELDHEERGVFKKTIDSLLRVSLSDAVLDAVSVGLESTSKEVVDYTKKALKNHGIKNK